MIKIHKTQQEKRSARGKYLFVGTSDKPRLRVFRSNKHIYVQAIDDIQHVTIASAHSLKFKKEKKIALAMLVGESLGNSLKKLGINGAIFDRGHYRYHGRVKALADSVRKAGITI